MSAIEAAKTPKSNRLIKRGGCAIFLAFPLLVLSYYVFRPQPFDDHPGPVSEVHAIPGTASENRYNAVFDAAVTDDGSMHVAWLEGERVRYTASYDDGRTWSAPIGFEENGRPAFVVMGDTLRLVVLRRLGLGLAMWASVDGGRTWGPPAEGLQWWSLGSASVTVTDSSEIWIAFRGNRHPPDPAPNPIFHRYENGVQTRYDPRSKPWGYYVSRSVDGGQTWRQPIPFRPVPDPLSSYEASTTMPPQLHGSPSIAAWEGRYFMAWNEDYANGGVLYLAVSDDDGQTWSEPRPLNRAEYEDRAEAHTFACGAPPYLVPTPVGLHLVRCAGGFFRAADWSLQGRPPGSEVLVLADDDGREWNEVEFLPELGGGAVAPDRTGVLLTTTTIRYMRRDWWVDTVLELWLGWSKSGLWANNDILVTRVGLSGAGPSVVLTPPLSYAEQAKLRRARGSTYVFWVGQSKVGRERDTYGTPDELFFTILTESDL